MSIKLRSLTLQCASPRGVRLRGVHHTVESSSRCASHHGVKLCGESSDQKFSKNSVRDVHHATESVASRLKLNGRQPSPLTRATLLEPSRLLTHQMSLTIFLARPWTLAGRTLLVAMGPTRQQSSIRQPGAITAPAQGMAGPTVLVANTWQFKTIV